MKQVKDYKFLSYIRKNILSIKTNGMTLNNIYFDIWNKTVSGTDNRNNIQTIDDKTFLKSYVTNIKNDGKKLILSSVDSSRAITGNNIINCPMTEHRKFKDLSHQFMSFNDIMEFKYLFYANYVTETFSREKKFDSIIFDRSDFLSNNKAIKCPNSIKRHYLYKNNRDNILISLNNIIIKDANVKNFFKYDRYLSLLIAKNKEEAIDNLFYMKLSEMYVAKKPIEIYSVVSDKIIVDIF